MYSENQPIPRRRDAAVEAAFDCAHQVFGGVEQVAQLNMQTVKTSLSEQQTLMDATLSAETVSEAIDLQSQLFSASVTKTFAYWRHVRDIAVQTQGGLFSAAHESIGYALGTLVEAATAASSGRVDQARSDAASLLVTAPVSGPVALVNSDGEVVSSSDPRGGRH